MSTDAAVAAALTAVPDEKPETIPAAKANALIVAALRAKIRSLIDQEPLTARVLLTISHTARIGQQLLTVEKDPRALMRHGLGLNSIGYSTGMDDDLTLGDSGVLIGQAPMSAPPAETFGASALRELVGVAREKMESEKKGDPVKLIEAIATARKHGLDSVADKLERELLGEDKSEIVKLSPIEDGKESA